MGLQIFFGKNLFCLLLFHILLQPNAATAEADEILLQVFGLFGIDFLLPLLLFERGEPIAGIRSVIPILYQ